MIRLYGEKYDLDNTKKLKQSLEKGFGEFIYCDLTTNCKNNCPMYLVCYDARKLYSHVKDMYLKFCSEVVKNG